MNAIATLSARLHQHRAMSNQTQQHYAEKLGVDVTTFGRWERGDIEPPLDRVVAIAQLMGCTTDYLLGLSSTATALPGDAWLVDLDLVDALRSNAPLPERYLRDMHGWGVAIPPRHAVLPSREYAALSRELAPRLASLHNRKK